MNIFIDAYNLLKQLHRIAQVTQRQKRDLVDQLKQFARSKGHYIYLVYDGGQSAWPEIERMGRLSIINSGYEMSADDVIKQKILQYAQEHTILVSDDRQLCDYVSAAQFVTIGTNDFYKLMQQDLKSAQVLFLHKGVAQKREGHESTAEVDELMQQASSFGYIKKESVEDNDHLRSRKLSKSEKKLKKIVRKL